MSFLLRIEELSSNANWIFRGQENAAWGLEPTLERTARKMAPECSHEEFLRSVRKFEKFTIEEFQRRAEIYLRDRPSPKDRFEWIALMQHHGAPTRLLDFTTSPLIALFFALKGAQGDSVVWGIEQGAIEDHARSSLGIGTQGVLGRANVANTWLYTEVGTPIAFVAEPFKLNQRQALQQGLFVFALGSSAHIFSEALNNNIGAPESAMDKGCLLKLVIVRSARESCIKMLHRMSITSEMLLPGLDGCASSLEMRYEATHCLKSQPE